MIVLTTSSRAHRPSWNLHDSTWEAAEAYDEAGRSDLAAKERTEGEIIAEYLPAQLSDDELAEIVRTAIADTGASGMKDMGAVMKLVQPQVKGRAEGGRVAAIVRSHLS
ncbi:MAG: GatB/YqeY domain-containing protein [Actinopolymorphaceae bacterium]